MYYNIKYKLLDRIIFFVVFIFVLFLSLPNIFIFYGKYGAIKFGEEISPKKRYAVEFYTLIDSKVILFPYDDPFFIKVYDFKKKNYVYESNVHSMLEITGISWPRKGLPNIIVGTGIITQDLELEEFHAIP